MQLIHNKDKQKYHNNNSIISIQLKYQLLACQDTVVTHLQSTIPTITHLCKSKRTLLLIAILYANSGNNHNRR